MRELHLHILPILGATVFRMVLGALWYSPALFLKPWMRMAGITAGQMKQGMGKKIAGGSESALSACAQPFQIPNSWNTSRAMRKLSTAAGTPA